MVIFVAQPDREIGIARTGVAVGMDELGRLVAYLTFETNKGLRASVDNPPSSARQSDRQVLLYVFLALAAFLAANQGEAPLQRTNEGSVIIG
jgi:apolipoprotein N-acyltransferase